MAGPKHPQPSNDSSKKRKNPPTDPTITKAADKSSNKRQKTDHRARQRDARILATQTSSKAFQNGALDINKFVQAREFEIRALERGIQRSGKANNRRAFQQVPRELRRRTASHNVKRIPKRLRRRAEKEMIEDNTPTITTKTRKLTRHMRMRMDNVKRLRALGAQRKAAKEKEKEEKVKVLDGNDAAAEKATNVSTKTASTVQTRKPKIKKYVPPTLSKPPIPKSKFRKRQLHKSWLPTHLYHTKRAHMTPPSAPLWRFAIPLTPTQKCYRPTHRAGWERGAVVWDTSYMATIGLEGRQESVESVLKGLGVDLKGGGEKWSSGRRVSEMWVYERESREPIAPVSVVWCVSGQTENKNTVSDGDEGKRKRKLWLRVHPSAFFQLWEEVVRLGKIAKPAVTVEDLRFEIGSIEITGPGSTEALLGALWPSRDNVEGSIGYTWTHFAGVTNPSILPEGALIGFDVQDPRLHHPPRTIKLPSTQEEHDRLLHLIADWPVDKREDLTSPAIFDRTARLEGSKLPSQKAVNRRRSLAPPGGYPSAQPTDPHIPIVLYASPSSNTSTAQNRSQHRSSPSSWTLLAPWKCIQPIWYSTMYYPLSTGQQPRFGGLNEKRQLAFETGRPWFPADFPGTRAGWEWEIRERRTRWEEWRRRPKGKRIAWEKVEVGGGRKGELGVGWACDWEFLVGEPQKVNEGDVIDVTADYQQDNKFDETKMETKKEKENADAIPPSKPEKLIQLSSAQALKRSFPVPTPSSLNLEGKLITVRLTLLTRGVPQTCARIYRLPSDSTKPDLRKAWLALLPSTKSKKNKSLDRKAALPNLPKDLPPHLIHRHLAASLLKTPSAGEDKYPSCPPEEDLIGFVTTGNFNLAEGKGTGVGSLLVVKILDDLRMLGKGDGRQKGSGGGLCVVRNSGEAVGRLGRWDIV